jgi:hypothetical protein
MPDLHLTKELFRSRFFTRFYDPAFDSLQGALERAFESHLARLRRSAQGTAHPTSKP